MTHRNLSLLSGRTGVSGTNDDAMGRDWLDEHVHRGAGMGETCKITAPPFYTLSAIAPRDVATRHDFVGMKSTRDSKIFL